MFNLIGFNIVKKRLASIFLLSFVLSSISSSDCLCIDRFVVFNMYEMPILMAKGVLKNKAIGSGKGFESLNKIEFTPEDSFTFNKPFLDNILAGKEYLLFSGKKSLRWKYIESADLKTFVDNRTVVIGLKSADGVKDPGLTLSIKAKLDRDYEVLLLASTFDNTELIDLIKNMKDILIFHKKSWASKEESILMFALCEGFLQKYSKKIEKESKFFDIVDSVKTRIRNKVKDLGELRFLSKLLLSSDSAYSVLGLNDYTEVTKDVLLDALRKSTSVFAKDASTVLLNDDLKKLYDEILKLKRKKVVDKSLIKIF